MYRAIHFALFLAVAGSANAQVNPSATASVALVARLPGSVTLTQEVFSAAFTVSQGVASSVTIPVDLRWNLNPRETSSFQVRARLSGLPRPWTQRVQASTDQQNFRLFNGSGELVLINQPVTISNRQGARRLTLTLQLSDAENPLPDGHYQALLRLEVHQQ